MQTTQGVRLSTSTPYIRDLNRQVRDGEIKVPKFQRPFVWESRQALALLDSVMHNYPIGSLLLWRTTDKLRTERDVGDFQLPQVDDLSPTEYVLDGQQRLTVLYSTVGAPDSAPGFSAVYDLEAGQFSDVRDAPPSLTRFQMRWLYETTKLLNFRTALQSHSNATTLQERFDHLVNVFTGYQIPVVTLRDLTIEEVCPIFERINSSGTPLSIFDILVAATWSNDFDLNDSVDEITLSMEPKNYGDVKGTTVLKCLAACRFGSVNRERVLGLRTVSADGQKMKELVAQTKTSLLRAIDTLLTDFRIYSLDFLPYEAHLVIMTYLYNRLGSMDLEQHKRLRQWFWRSSFSERYRGAPDTLVTRDLELVLKFVTDGEVESSEMGDVPKDAELRNAIFRKNNSRSRAFTLALAKADPVNLTNAAPIDTADALSVYNRKQFHHIYPDAYLRRVAPSAERAYLLNFCMLAASENNAVSDRDPHEYLPQLAESHGDAADDVFDRNLLPLPSQFDYSVATLDEFLAARLPIVRARITRLCSGIA